MICIVLLACIGPLIKPPAEVVCQADVGEFWGGDCNKASGECRKCCSYPKCDGSGNPATCKGLNRENCEAVATWKVNVKPGFSCEDAKGKKCQKSNTGTCQRTYDCQWDTWNKDCYSWVQSEYPAYLTCETTDL